MKAPSAAPRTRIVRITRLLEWSGLGPPARRQAPPGVKAVPSLARSTGGRQGARRSGSAGPPGRLLAERGADGVPEGAHHDDVHARDRRQLTASGPRDQRAREPEPRGLAQPPVEAPDRAQLAQQADLADGDRARDHRTVAERRRERKRE